MPNIGPDDPNAPDLQQVRALFEGAMLVPESDRNSWVARAARGDDRLRDEVLQMLAASRLDTAQLNQAIEESREPATDALTEGQSPVQSTATGALMTRLRTAPPLDSQRFVCEGELGKGGMGLVLRIHDQVLNRRLAMKVLLERRAPRDDEERRLANQLLGRFLEEAQVTSQLDHPGIVPVHELGLDSAGKVYFTMRLVKGRVVSEVFADALAERNEWDLTRALEVVLKVCDTMAYAHEKGVLHRDLKPSNVMVGRFGEVYVMDWGLAKVLGQKDRHDLRIRTDASTGVSRLATARRVDAEAEEPNSIVSMDGQQLGTPSYMSPEQARSEEPDVRADVYSIGAMLYELVTGRAPFTGPSGRKPAYAILDELLEGPPRRVEDVRKGVPAPLVAVIEKAMARDREQRYASVRELAGDLRAFLAQRVVAAYRTGAWQETKLWIRRNRLLAASMTAAAASLIVGIATISALWQGAERAKNDALTRQRQFEMMALVLSHDRLVATEPAAIGSPEQLPTLETWLGDAKRLLRKHEVAKMLSWFQSVSHDDTPAARDAARFLHLSLEELEAKLPKFQDLVTSVERKRQWTQAVQMLTQAHPNAPVSWAEARAAIAKNPRYDGQTIPLLAPDIWGLVPIGENPQSGLWEFYDLRSAWDGKSDPSELGNAPIPRPDATGRYSVEARSGIVWVLIPGSPVRPIELDGTVQPGRSTTSIAPFLISKFEVTRGQWQRWRTQEPAKSKRPDSPTMPVTGVNWFLCDQTLRDLGLRMPSELQAQYAVGAGKTTSWWSGDDPASILQAENLGADSQLLPVGSKSPNPFGLMDLAGNVWEWCQDEYRDFGTERAGDGRRVDSAEVLERSIRGGGHGDKAEFGKTGFRHKNVPTSQGPFLGVRPVRSLPRARD